MTATDELRRMLDERGVEHGDASYKRNTPITSWTSGDSTFCFVEEPSKHTSLHIEECTPKQAVAATIGVDSNTEETVRKLLDKLSTELCNAGCGVECETREERRRLIDATKDKYAQAIAATVGAWTCHNTSEYTNVFECSECGYWYDFVTDPYQSPNFCPRCGKRIEVKK